MIVDDFSARQPDRPVRLNREVSSSQFREFRRAGIFQNLAFETVLGNMNWNAGTHGEIAWQMTTSADFFDVLGVGALAGRLYPRRHRSHSLRHSLDGRKRRRGPMGSRHVPGGRPRAGRYRRCRGLGSGASRFKRVPIPCVKTGMATGGHSIKTGGRSSSAIRMCPHWRWQTRRSNASRRVFRCSSAGIAH